MPCTTLLLGIDGATFDVLDPLMRAGAMPALARLTAAGTRAVLRSTVPALTPPAWTSMVTGRGPGAHGIFDFFRKHSATSLHFGFVTSREVACPSLWSMATDAGLRSTVLNFPLTFPPPKIAGGAVILRRFTSREHAGIDSLSRARDGVEVHLVAGYFSGHEYQIGIESFRRDSRFPVDVSHP